MKVLATIWQMAKGLDCFFLSLYLLFLRVLPPVFQNIKADLFLPCLRGSEASGLLLLLLGFMFFRQSNKYIIDDK